MPEQPAARNTPATTPPRVGTGLASGLASGREGVLSLWRSGQGSVWVAVGWLVLWTAAAFALVVGGGGGAGDALGDALDLSRRFR